MAGNWVGAWRWILFPDHVPDTLLAGILHPRNETDLCNWVEFRLLGFFFFLNAAVVGIDKVKFVIYRQTVFTVQRIPAFSSHYQTHLAFRIVFPGCVNRLFPVSKLRLFGLPSSCEI